MVNISNNSEVNKNQLVNQVEKIVSEEKETKKDLIEYTYLAIAGAKTKGIEFKRSKLF